MTYRNNYLDQVIFQLRFPLVLQLETESPVGFQERVGGQFPNLREGKEIELTALLSMGSQDPAKAEMSVARKRWIFEADDKSKSVTIAANLFSLEYKKYDDIEQAKRDFGFLWTAFTELYPVKTLDRVGLRYVNVIRLGTGGPLDWDGWITPEIVSATIGTPSPSGHQLARSIHAAHYVDADQHITFKFGIHNSDFPNAVAKREFVLDYDCYSTEPREASDAAECLTRYNGAIYRLFDLCMGPKLREEMDDMGNAAPGKKGAAQNAR